MVYAFQKCVNTYCTRIDTYNKIRKFGVIKGFGSVLSDVLTALIHQCTKNGKLHQLNVHCTVSFVIIIKNFFISFYKKN